MPVRDLSALASRVPGSSGRSKYVRHDEAVATGAFVCPRADAHGGRDGIIPPGVAAQNGLVPRGMRHVGNADVLRTRRAAQEDGKTDAEHYAEYYGRGAGQPERPERPVQGGGEPGRPAGGKSGEPRQYGGLAESAVAVLLKAGYSVRPDGSVVPPAAGRDDGSVGDAGGGRAGHDASDAGCLAVRAASTPPAAPAKPENGAGGVRGKRAGTAAKGRGRAGSGAAARGRGSAGVSRKQAAPDGADTLDGFYDELESEADGTCVPDRVPAEGAAAGASGGHAGSRGAPPDDFLRLLAGAIGERDEARAEYAGLLARYEADAARCRALEAEAAELRSEAASRVSRTPVRVILSAEPERMKIGGRDVLGDAWELRIEGHFDFSASRDEGILTVLDRETASELLARISPGDVILVTAEGRLACSYSGICEKLYGDQASGDFITCIRLGVAEESRQ